MPRVLPAAAVLLLLAASCGPKAGPSPREPAPQPATPAAEAVAAKPADARPADAKPADAREKLLAETLARAREIQDEVALVRALPFKRDIPAERQSREDFGKFVSRELKEELSKDESEKESKAYYHLGFLTKKVDLLHAMADLTTAQVAAYYNPEDGKFYAVSLSSDKTWLEVMTAHELTHGLQDQYFDLQAYYGEKPKLELSEDQLNARRFVVEGEASFVMLLHMVAKQTSKLAALAKLEGKARAAKLAELTPQVRMMVALMAGTPWQKLAEETADQSKKIEGVDAAQVASVKDVPPLILVPMLESYTRGALAIAEVQRAGGWDAVAKLYAEPPQSTEQVLHAADKLAGPRDYPTAVSLPDYSAKDGKPLLDETVGELGWRVYLETWKIDAAMDAAAGWDGDRLAVYRTPDGLVGFAAIDFDTVKDAKEFASAFAASLERRFPKGAEKARSGARFRRSDRGEVRMERRGRDVFIVDGAAAAKAGPMLEALARGIKKKTDKREKRAK